MSIRVAALPSLDPDAQQFRYGYLSLGQDVVLDLQGRIQISSDYRERAGLVKEVLVVGMQKMFEVWDAERWVHFRRASDSGEGEESDRVAESGALTRESLTARGVWGRAKLRHRGARLGQSQRHSTVDTRSAGARCRPVELLCPQSAFGPGCDKTGRSTVPRSAAVSVCGPAAAASQRSRL